MLITIVVGLLVILGVIAAFILLGTIVHLIWMREFPRKSRMWGDILEGGIVGSGIICGIIILLLLATLVGTLVLGRT